MDRREYNLCIEQLESRLGRARDGAVAALRMVLELKDLKTGRYAAELSRWAVRVGSDLGMKERQLSELEIATLLYDIGKIGVPDEILLKPGKLDVEQWERVRKHPEFGWGILRSIPGFERVALLVLHHQERYDGSGYPAGLAGEKIPLGSRIVAVVDALEAMLSHRPYRRSLTTGEVIRRLRPLAGVQFDPRVVEEFITVAGWSVAEISRSAMSPRRDQSSHGRPGADPRRWRAAP